MRAWMSMGSANAGEDAVRKGPRQSQSCPVGQSPLLGLLQRADEDEGFRSWAHAPDTSTGVRPQAAKVRGCLTGVLRRSALLCPRGRALPCMDVSLACEYGHW